MIFTVNLYPDRLEIHSPGPLPIGVTPKNIIHQSVRRNEHLAKVFYDLQLMEKEGSGFDKVYQILLSDGKKPPLVTDSNDRVTVIVRARIFNIDALKLMDKANNDFHLKQRELIVLGLVAQNNVLSTIEFSNLLSLKEPHLIGNWLGNLLEYKIVLSKGRTKGTEYFINPSYLKKIGYRGKTNLKLIEDHRLRELILADLKKYPSSSIGEIQTRIGSEITRKKVRTQLEHLIEKKIVTKEGSYRHTKYSYIEIKH